MSREAEGQTGQRSLITTIYDMSWILILSATQGAYDTVFSSVPAPGRKAKKLCFATAEAESNEKLALVQKTKVFCILLELRLPPHSGFHCLSGKSIPKIQ